MNEQYRKLSSNSKILYALFLNRMNYSKKNLRMFSDSNGVFIYYSNLQIQKHLCCSVHTAIDSLKELEQAGLIRKEYPKRGLPLKIYVNDIRARDSATQKPQDELLQKPYNNPNYNAKPHKSNSAPQEKQVSFDVEKAEEMKLKHLYNFAEKTKKRRTRDVGPTI